MVEAVGGGHAGYSMMWNQCMNEYDGAAELTIRVFTVQVNTHSHRRLFQFVPFTTQSP